MDTLDFGHGDPRDGADLGGAEVLDPADRAPRPARNRDGEILIVAGETA